MSGLSIIPLPAYAFRLRLAQFIIAILVLVLDIIATAIFFSGALGYGIFTPLATCIIVGYWYYATYRNKQYYNRWAILVLECFSVIWWLSLWSVMAQWASALGFIDSLDSADGFNDLGDVRTVHILTALAAVLGAAEFVLFIITLILYSTSLHRTRVAERAHAQQNPFTNINYETGDGPGMGSQGNRPKGGFQSEVA